MGRDPIPRLIPALLIACAASARVHPRAAEEVTRGYTYLKDGDSERAEVAFDHALAFNPDFPEAMNGRGIVERRRGRLDEARRWYEGAVRVSPDFAEAHSNLGEVFLTTAHYLRAEREFTAALRIDPDMPDARLNLARALLHRGRESPAERAELWARSRREYLHLLEAQPRLADAHHDLGYLDYESGAFGRAEGSYRRAVEIDPSSVGALHGLCISLARLGHCQQAAEQCRRCLQVAPGTERCEKSLRGALACLR